MKKNNGESRLDIDTQIHDLRTPLTNIKTYTHLLKKTQENNPNPKADKYLSVIEENTTRLLNLLNEFAQNVRQELKDRS